MEKNKLDYWHYLKVARIYHIAGHFEDALKFYDEAILSNSAWPPRLYLYRYKGRKFSYKSVPETVGKIES